MDAVNPNSAKMQHRTRKDRLIFSLIWLGEGILVLVVVKWVFHGNAAFYLLMIPWAGLGLVIVLRPNWALRMSRAMENNFNRDMEKESKWWDVF